MTFLGMSGLYLCGHAASKEPSRMYARPTPSRIPICRAQPRRFGAPSISHSAGAFTTGGSAAADPMTSLAIGGGGAL